MKKYIMLSYNGDDITPVVIVSLGNVLKEYGVTTEEVHGICIDEAEVCSILAKNTQVQTPVEISVVESACIYAQRRFGKYFGQGLKLTLAVGEDVINHPQDKALIQAVKTLSNGISSKMRAQYGISTEDISVFKQISKNIQDV